MYGKGRTRVMSVNKASIAVLSAGVAVAVAAWQPAASAPRAPPASTHPGLTVAQGTCAGCHAIVAHEVSPNPKAPPFAAIVNSPGLTPETLSTWLRDAHNYPEEMEFYLEGPEVDQLVAYMLSLRDPNYRPGI
jgi:mono/diheme cytochrome c family protein